MPTAGFFSKALGSGLGQLIAAIVGLAAIYKFFIEFVEPDELAVRSKNNKPDFYHHPMSWSRRVIVIVSTVGLVISAALAMLNGRWSWYYWLSVTVVVLGALLPPVLKWPLRVTVVVGVIGLGAVGGLAYLVSGLSWYYWLSGAFLALSILVQALSSWPRTDVPAVVGPGIKLKVPGLIAYKHANLAVMTNTVLIVELVDGSGELVTLEVIIDWMRGARSTRLLWETHSRIDRLIPTHRLAIIETGQLLWRSMFGVDNLERSVEGVAREAALVAGGSTENLVHPSSEEKAAFCRAVFLTCEGTFQDSFGTTLCAVRLGRTGPHATVTAVQTLVPAVEGLAAALERWRPAVQLNGRSTDSGES